MSARTAIFARACEATGGNGLGDQYINPTGDCSVSAFHVQLSLAGGITDPFHLIFKVLMSITWTIYQFQVIALAWITDFVLSMTWLNWFTDVVGGIQDSVAAMLSNLNIYVAMLTITAFICIIWMARGLWGKGLLQLLVSLVVANYALAAISYDREHPENNITPINPIGWLLGNHDDGMLFDARDTAQSLVGTITQDPDYIENLDAEVSTTVTPGQSILDTFLYHPAMLINFGTVLTGDCEQAYVTAMSYAGNGGSKDDLKNALDGLSGRGSAADGVDTSSELTDPGTWWGGTGDEPVDYDPEVWKVVGKCVTDDVDAYARMARPDSWMAQIAVQPAVTILAVLILIIAGVVFIAGLSALVQCVKLLVTLLLAILPGGARAVLWRNIGQLFATVLMLIFAIVFLGVFLHVLTDVMASGSVSGGGGGMRWGEIGKFLLIDLMLVAGIVLFWRGRGAVHETKERVAAAMAGAFSGGGGGGMGGVASRFGPRGGMGGPGGLGGFGGVGGVGRFAGNFHLASDVARDLRGSVGASRGGGLGGMLRRTGRIAGTVGAAWATGGGSLAAKGGAMAAKSQTLRRAGRATANAGRHGVEIARRARVNYHLQHGNFAAANRIGTYSRRAEMAKAVRADQARLNRFDRGTRRAEAVSRLTWGRFGAERVNTAPEERRRLIREMRRDRQRLKRTHRAQARTEKARLTPEELRSAEARERRLRHQAQRRRVMEDQRNVRREARRKRNDES